jgi:hypothetical protein
MPVDSAYKTQEMPPFAKKGEYIKVRVNVLATMTKEEFEKQKQEETKMETENKLKPLKIT